MSINYLGFHFILAVKLIAIVCSIIMRRPKAKKKNYEKAKRIYVLVIINSETRFILKASSRFQLGSVANCRFMSVKYNFTH